MASASASTSVAMMYGLRTNDRPSETSPDSDEASDDGELDLVVEPAEVRPAGLAVFGSQSRHSVRPTEIGNPHFSHLRMVDASPVRVLGTGGALADDSNKADFNSA